MPRRKTILGLVAGFFAATFFLYGHSLGSEFVRWDDGMLVYENPAIRAITPRTVGHIFTTYDPELYIPITFLSYQIDYQLSGIDPWLYHLDNLVLHTLNALLVAWIGFLLFRKGSVGILIGLIFAVHPLHTEAVEWVSARKDVLSTFFFLLSIIGYLSFRETGRTRPLALSLLAFVLGLMAKVMVITLPVVLVLLDLLQGRKFWSKEALREKVPYLLIALVFGLIALGGKTAVIQSSSLTAKVLMAFKSAAFYLQKIFWPTDLSLLYPYNGSVTITSPDFFLPILIIVAVAAFGAWAWRRGWKEVTFGLLFFAITVAPTFINFAKGAETDVYFASDRYAYVPSIGILIALGGLLLRLLERFPHHARQWLLVGIGAACVLPLSALAYAQSFVWQNTETLFRNVLEHYPASSYVAHNNLGNAYRLKNQFAEAITEYEQALAIHPHPKTFSNLGATYRKLGQFEKALEQYRKALELDPRSKEAHMGLGIVYAAQGSLAQAEAEYRAAVEIDPAYEEAQTNLGVVLFEQGKVADAVAAYRAALAANPFFPDAHYNLALALTQKNQLQEAINEYLAVIDTVPGTIPARINLALLLYKTGDIDGAREQFKIVLRIDPDNAAAKKALSQIGR